MMKKQWCKEVSDTVNNLIPLLAVATSLSFFGTFTLRHYPITVKRISGGRKKKCQIWFPKYSC